MNDQTPEKLNIHPLGVLEVHHLFHSIQGEGPFVGCPAVFIRLTGCNLQCPNCDEDYTSKRTPMNPATLMDAVKEFQDVNLLVITGGEPLRQNLAPFLCLAIEAGYRVQIETNGTLYNPSIIYEEIMVVCSPKTGAVNKHLLPHIDAWKYVVNSDESNISKEDGLPIRALGHPAKPYLQRPPKGALVYVQPEDEGCALKTRVNIKTALNICFKYKHYLCLQIHKMLEME